MDPLQPGASVDVLVVGGGLAGLTAAIAVARAGRTVHLLEAAPTLGGRATTSRQQGFSFNQGPHALYRGQAADRFFQSLKLPLPGRAAPTGGYAVWRGERHLLPVTPGAMLRTTLLGLGGKAALVGALARVLRLNPAALPPSQTVSGWLATHVRDERVRALLGTLVTIATYSAARDRLSARDAFTQLQRAVRHGVLYLDGGWQTIVDQLEARLGAHGIGYETGARVVHVVEDAHGCRVQLTDGRSLHAGAVILAGAPGTAVALTTGETHDALTRLAAGCEPVKAACLDVALSRLPNPEGVTAFGLDSPLYLAVHSLSATLAPPGGAMIHVAKYLDPTRPESPQDVERELEAHLDFAQPGWRDVLVTRRWLPAMTVAHGLVAAAQGGQQGRADAAAPHATRLFLAGDWVGPEGMLADASVASALEAARLAAAVPAATPVTPAPH